MHLHASEELKGASSHISNRLRRPSPPQPPVSASLPRSLSQVAAPLRSTTLAAYREAELQGAVQVREPGAAAPQACTAQTAVRDRLPARRQRRGKRGLAGHAGATRGLPGSSRPAAPTWAARGFRRSTAIAAPRRSNPREAQRCGLSSARPSHAPRPRRATLRPSPALRLPGTRSPPPIRAKCRRGSDQPANHILAANRPALI
ncbi:uncharacterized protein LOC143267892 [Peromyscus maniculatus bairdii]|uniref:uncharacterized protein LOC143267892 n=1 Tax=Peromyscus maniculatus bairdii TaxID=230844 RepID=UPI003FD62EC7